jgi:hypothetical protein
MIRLAAIGQKLSLSKLELTLLMAVLALIAWNFNREMGIDWEFMQTKHYFHKGYYGGYTHEILFDQGRTLVTSSESLPCLYQTYSFLSPTDSVYTGAYNVDRLYTCGFLPSLVERLSGGSITLRNAIYFSNILTWLAAILLSYLTAKAWFNNRLTGMVAAVLAAGYPVYPLLLDTLKAQSAGAAIFLGWVYIDKTVWPRIGWPERCLLLLCTFVATMLASGAAFYIFCYMVVRRLYLAAVERVEVRENIAALLVAIVTFGLAKLATNMLLQHYHIQSALAAYDVGRIARESLQFLSAAIHGEDVSQLRLLNHLGYSLFTAGVPRYVSSFVSGNPVVVVLPFIAVFTQSTCRSLLACVPVLFFVGLGYVVITGWDWYYGYGPAAAGHVLIILAAVSMASLLGDRRIPARLLGAVLLIAATYWFNSDWKFNMENFYDNVPFARGHLFVYHGPDVVQYW